MSADHFKSAVVFVFQSVKYRRKVSSVGTKRIVVFLIPALLEIRVVRSVVKLKDGAVAQQMGYSPGRCTVDPDAWRGLGGFNDSRFPVSVTAKMGPSCFGI